MRLLIHNKPKLKMPEFKVDEPLSKHLDDPLLSNMNKSFSCGFLLILLWKIIAINVTQVSNIINYLAKRLMV